MIAIDSRTSAYAESRMRTLHKSDEVISAQSDFIVLRTNTSSPNVQLQCVYRMSKALNGPKLLQHDWMIIVPTSASAMQRTRIWYQAVGRATYRLCNSKRLQRATTLWRFMTPCRRWSKRQTSGCRPVRLAPFSTPKLTDGRKTSSTGQSRCCLRECCSQNLSLSLSRCLPLLFSYRPAGGISAPCLPAGDLLRLEEPLQCQGRTSHTWHCSCCSLQDSQSVCPCCPPLLTGVSMAHPYVGLESGVGSV